MKNFNATNFQAEVLDSELPVLVDFWSPTCRPCIAMAPTLVKVEVELEGKAKVGKVDASENLDLAKRYGVTGLPTFLVFHGGKVVAEARGVTPKEKLRGLVENLGPGPL